MELTLLERVLLTNEFNQGDILYMRLRNEMFKKLNPSDEEIVKYSFVQKNGQASWAPDIPTETEIELTDIEMGMLQDCMITLNRERRLTPGHVSLYEKFVEDRSK